MDIPLKIKCLNESGFIVQQFKNATHASKILKRSENDIRAACRQSNNSHIIKNHEGIVYQLFYIHE